MVACHYLRLNMLNGSLKTACSIYQPLPRPHKIQNKYEPEAIPIPLQPYIDPALHRSTPTLFLCKQLVCLICVKTGALTFSFLFVPQYGGVLNTQIPRQYFVVAILCIFIEVALYLTVKIKIRK